MDCSPLGSCVYRISQARILECVAISFSKGSFQSRDRICVSCIGRQILYHWATRVIILLCYNMLLYIIYIKLTRLWCWEGLGAGGEGDDRGWDGWMASPTQWMWVWVNSKSWWWTGRPGMLRFMGLQRVRHNWATEMNWIEKYTKEYHICLWYIYKNWSVKMCMRNNKASSGKSRRISSGPGSRQRILRTQKGLTINKLTIWTALKLRSAWRDKKWKSNTIKKQFKSNTESRKKYLWYIYLRTKFKIHNKLLQIYKRQFNYYKF